MRVGALLLALCCTAAAQTQIARLRAKIAESITRQSECTCTQTVERVYDTGRGCDAKSFTGPKKSWDRLRLDVALRDRIEVYSFPGESEFDAGRLIELSAENTGGNFGRLLVEIFEKHEPEIVGLGETQEDGRRLAQFSFTLPKSSEKRAPTPYSGTVLVDAETFDLVRVVMNAPRDPGSECGGTTTIDYADQLPTRAKRRIQSPRAPRIEIDTGFSACRKLLALPSKTDQQQLPIGSAPPGAIPLTIPRRIPFTVEFEQDIDSATAVAGEAIRGHTITPIVDEERRMLVLEDAAVVARIMRIRHLKSDRLELVVRLESIEIGGKVQPLFARPRGASERGAALIHLPSRHGTFVVEKGSLSEWRTEDQ